MQNSSNIRVGMIILMVSDVEAALSFYQKIGLKVKFHLKGKWAELLFLNTRLGLCPTSQEPFERHTGIVIEVDNINDFIENLKKEGIELLKEPVAAVHGIMTNIKDPSGNVIDIYQPTPDKVQDFAKKVSDMD